MHPWVFYFRSGKKRVSESEYLAKKEFDGKLSKSLSAEFSGNAAQITITPASGKTFYHARSKLYPVVNTISLPAVSGGTNVVNRRADVELTNDSTVIDVLTYDFEGWQFGAVIAASSGPASQQETNIMDSLDGDGAKTMTLTSTNTSGTYRVSMIGFTEDTGDDPTI